MPVKTCFSEVKIMKFFHEGALKSLGNFVLHFAAIVIFFTH